MQLLSELRIPMATQANVASGSDDAQADSGEPAGLAFADLLQSPLERLAAAPAGEPALPVAELPLPGKFLPPAGDLLPSADPGPGIAAANEAPPAPPLATTPSYADVVAVAHNGENFAQFVLPANPDESINALDRRLVIATPDDESTNALDRRLLIATPDDESINALDRRLVIATPDDESINALDRRLLIATPDGESTNALDRRLAIATTDSASTNPLAGALRSTGNAGYRDLPIAIPDTATTDALASVAKSLDDSAIQRSLAGPAQPGRVVSAAPPALPDILHHAAGNSERTPVPAAEAGSALARQHSLLHGPSVPELANPRRSDSQVVKRSAPPQFALANGQEIRPGTANRGLREFAALKFQAETHGLKRLSPVTPPPTHASFAGLPVTSVQAAAAVSAAVPVVSIDTPVLDPAWAQAVHERVLWLAGKGIQNVEIRLHPVELGPLQVQVAVDDDSVTVAFTAAHATTREALETALPRLKDMLAENGLSLTDASVADQGIANQREENAHSRPADYDPAEEELAQAGSVPMPGQPSARVGTGLVDTYV